MHWLASVIGDVEHLLALQALAFIISKFSKQKSNFPHQHSEKFLVMWSSQLGNYRLKTGQAAVPVPSSKHVGQLFNSK